MEFHSPRRTRSVCHSKRELSLDFPHRAPRFSTPSSFDFPLRTPLGFPLGARRFASLRVLRRRRSAFRSETYANGKMHRRRADAATAAYSVTKNNSCGTLHKLVHISLGGIGHNENRLSRSTIAVCYVCALRALCVSCMFVRVCSMVSSVWRNFVDDNGRTQSVDTQHGTRTVRPRLL